MGFAKSNLPTCGRVPAGNSAGQETGPAQKERTNSVFERLITMTALTRWNPYEDPEAAQNPLSSFFDWAPVRCGNHAPTANELAPLIDLIERGDEYLIRTNLPGVNENELSVTLGNAITVKASKL